jgi:hypothetical protein
MTTPQDEATHKTKFSQIGSTITTLAKVQMPLTNNMMLSHYQED